MQSLALVKTLLLLLLAITTTTETATAQAASIDALQLMPFHPISRAEYEAILGLTNGQQTISEARLVASGLAALKGLIAGLKAGLSGTFLASWVGASPTSTTTFSDGYPLCVINANAGKKPVIEHHQLRQNDNQHDSYQHDPYQHDAYQHDYYQQEHEQRPEEQHDDHNMYSPHHEQQMVSPNPLVNCVVVTKKKKGDEEDTDDKPDDSSKPDSHNSWPQHHHYQQQPPAQPWYGYPTTAYYGFPPPPPPPQPLPYHHYRSDPVYPSYPSSSGGYHGYSAYSSYPQHEGYSPYARQQSPLGVQRETSPTSTTPAPTAPPTTPTTTRKPSTSRPHIHSLKPIKHLTRKRKRPVVTDNLNSAEVADVAEYSQYIETPPPRKQPQHTKPNIQIHKIDRPYHAESDDQADSMETTETYHHHKAQNKRPVAVSNQHNKRKEYVHRQQSVKRPEQHEDEQESTESLAQPQYAPQNSHKHKRPAPPAYVDESADSAETTTHTKYPKQEATQHKRPKPTSLTTYGDSAETSSHNNDHEEQTNSEETASYPVYAHFTNNYQSEQDTHHTKPTERPVTLSTRRPRPVKHKKRKHSNNPATVPQRVHSSYEHTSASRPTLAAPNKSEESEQPSEYPHVAANYAELAEYPHDSYQPAPYPQLNYQSTYPKVSYTQAQSHPAAPVYVKDAKIPSMPTSTESSQQLSLDSSESENSAEFIKVRQSDYNERVMW